MADVKISELTAQASASVDVSADVLAVVDTSATQTKKISVENLLSPITIDKSAGTITSLGTVTGNVDFNGDLDVDGTTNLDVVDIDGAVDMASTLTVGGDVNITADGARFFVSSATNELVSIGRAGSSGDALQQGYLRMKAVDSGTLTNKIALHTAGDSYFNGGSVGLGTTSPSSYDNYYNNLVVSEDGNAGIAIIGSTSGESSLGFGDGTGAATYRGAVAYVHTSGDHQDKMFFKTAATNRMVIDSSGQMGVGTISPRNTIHSTGIVEISNADSNADTERIRFGRTSDNQRYSSIFHKLSDSAANNHILFKLHDGSSQTEVLRIQGDNKIGFGGLLPAQKYDFRGDNHNDIMRMYDSANSDNIWILRNEVHSGTSSGRLQLLKGDGDGVELNGHDGRTSFIKSPLAIGGTTATEKLTVHGGDILVDSARGVRANGGNEMIRFSDSSGVMINSGGALRTSFKRDGSILHHGTGTNVGMELYKHTSGTDPNLLFTVVLNNASGLYHLTVCEIIIAHIGNANPRAVSKYIWEIENHNSFASDRPAIQAPVLVAGDSQSITVNNASADTATFQINYQVSGTSNTAAYFRVVSGVTGVSSLT